jgi:hypothetical protein
VLVFVCLALLLVLPRPASAQGADPQEFQLWLQALAIGPISENWRAHLELQPRWFDDAETLGLVIARGAVGRRILPRATLFGGFAMVPRTFQEPTRQEKRIWEQLSLDLPAAGRWAMTGRIRVEQRWLDTWDDSSHRVRLMLRTQRPLGASPWMLALYDETMVTLDVTGSGPRRGYDRNRAYAGLMRRVSPLLTAEFGYIWENSTIFGPSQRNDHIAIGVLNLGLFRRN